MEFLAQNAVKILAVMALVIVNGFFVAAEFAFVKLRRTQLDPLVAKKHGGARLARHILSNVTSYLSATQLGITICSLGLGWFGEPVFTSLLQPVLAWMQVRSPHVQHSISFAVGFSVITFLQIVLGELGPKWVAIDNALPTALLLARPLRWFYRASYPFNWILNQSARWLLRRIGIEPTGGGHLTHSEEELRLMLGQKRAGSTLLSRDIVLNALDLGRRTVREVMRPRKEISALSTEDGISQCLDIAEKTRFSRFPLCKEGDLDKTLGVVHTKDLFAVRMKASTGADLLQVARKLIYVAETARLEKMLQLFLDRRLHFAIVVDEYGGTVGMVTLENILEELVGQIQDEFDQEKPLIRQHDDHTWEVDGSLPLHTLEELVGQPLVGDGIVTTSGWVTRQLNGFPQVNNIVALPPFELRVIEMDGPMVSRLKLTKTIGSVHSGGDVE